MSARKTVLRCLLLLIVTAVFSLLPFFRFSALPAGAQTSTPFRVYLTFEDGPTDSYTPQILDILAQYNARATFFVNGNQLRGRDYLLQRMIREGHAIGNHLWSEPGLYAGAPDDDVRASYFRTEEAIRAGLGPELPAYEAQVRLFRQPGGGARSFPETEGVQVITYNWHVDGDDCGWRLDPDSPLLFDDQVLGNVLDIPRSLDHLYNVYDYGDGVVVVLHDINRVTGRVLPIILSELQQAGATFEALPRPEDSPGAMPVVLGMPPTETPGIPGATLTAYLRDYAYVRSAPDEAAPLVVVSLSPDTSLTVTGRSQAWYQVVYEGQTGWIHRANVRVLGPIPSLPVIDQ